MSEQNLLKAKNYADILKICNENEADYINCKFTDPRGKRHHVSFHMDMLDEDTLKDGLMFDASSIAGWKAINESDMQLLPDASRIAMDPFAAQPTLEVFCDIVDPTTNKAYNRDPRSISKAAEAYLQTTGIADTAFFGPEAEFFIFDDIKINISMNHVGVEIDSEEGPYNSGKAYENGNLGHRPRVKGGYFPETPVDSGFDLRAEMLTVMRAMGVPVEKHHHEVAASQHELGIKYSTLVNCADNMQLYKYVVMNVAHAYGKTATFMPKPVYGDNGSGMHVHQSLWRGGKPLFAGDKYAGLSQECLWYIGGIIKHARALNAFTNPTTNSYKRLVPGYEAPVLLAYSSRNRSASCRIPFTSSPKAKRVEVRFPDPLANPYLAYSAMLMAGLDGIQNKVDPGDAMDKNLYELPPEELEKVPTVCGSLREAVESLHRDHEFLLKGDVFSTDMIEGYFDLKMEEIEKYETMPHPIEFDMYYSS